MTNDDTGNPQNPIRVLLADDHPALRIGLRVLLEQAGLAVVAEAADGEQALAQIRAHQPDVAVLDCQLPGLDGVSVAAEIKRQGWPTRVLALSSYSDEQYVQGMMDAGALGYLSKEDAPGMIVAAARAAAQGRGVWTVEQITRARQWEQDVKARWEQLTEREREVLALMAQGQSNRDIADKLCVTEKTVEKHVSNVLGKLMLASRTEAALWVVKAGLLTQ